MARLDDLKIRRISLMTFPEVMEHIKEARFRRRTEAKKPRAQKEKVVKVKEIPMDKFLKQMSLEDIQRFLQVKGKG